MRPEALGKAAEERAADADKRELQDSYCMQAEEFMANYRGRTSDLIEDANSIYKTFDKMKTAWEILHCSHLDAQRAREGSMSVKMKEYGLPTDHEITDLYFK